MKRLATLMLSLLAALEVFLSVIAFGGCTSVAPATAPQSAIVVAYSDPGVE